MQPRVFSGQEGGMPTRSNVSL
uniref:Uncharacterized protein n=1 Tax=Anguilla anguilla TaxID=7936 RepID=A0A0E9VYE4_ANGAN